MEFNFYLDLESELQRILQEHEIPIPTSQQLRSQSKQSEGFKNSIPHYDITNLLHHTLTVFFRRIPVKKWNTYKSKNLKSCNDINQIINKLTHSERKNLRVKAMNTNVIVDDGTEYFPPGGGHSASKLPAHVHIKSGKLLNKIECYQQDVNNNIDVIKENLKNYTSTPMLKLILDDNFEPHIIESTKDLPLEFTQRNVDEQN